MNNLIAEVTRDQLKKQVPDFRAGDTIRVAVRIVEGDKERIQNFEGVCIAKRGTGLDETFTVRRVSYGVGMERTFPLHSPRVDSVSVIRHGKVRRSKLYYLRDLTGKKARLSETRRKRAARGTMVDVEQPAAPAPELAAEAPKEETPEPAAEATEEKTAEAATEAPTEETVEPATEVAAEASAEKPAEETDAAAAEKAARAAAADAAAEEKDEVEEKDEG